MAHSTNPAEFQRWQERYYTPEYAFGRAPKAFPLHPRGALHSRISAVIRLTRGSGDMERQGICLLMMIQPLEDAIGKVLRLSKEKQEIAAELLEQLAQAEGEPYILSPAERATVREALAHAQRGEFAGDAEVNDVLRKPWA